MSIYRFDRLSTYIHSLMGARIQTYTYTLARTHVLVAHTFKSQFKRRTVERRKKKEKQNTPTHAHTDTLTLPSNEENKKQ